MIHTVGPVWDGGSYGETGLLHSCYAESLKLALQYDCKSIAFPMIATNNYGFPKDKALQIAISAFSEFLLEHEMMIYLVVFDRSAYKLSEKLFHSITSYIDDHYVDAWVESVYGTDAQNRQQDARCRRDLDLYRNRMVQEETRSYALTTVPKTISLNDLLQQADAGFSETLLKLIDKTGKKDSEIYKKANLSKQHFSKIRNNPDYKPTKQTAIALALALELDLEQTKDFIGRAGYALSNSSKFDLVIRYFIEQRKYNVMEINMALYELDQNLLGS